MSSTWTDPDNWDSTTLDLVDWEAHGIAVRGAPHPVTVVKMLHNLLPVGARICHYHPRHSKYCPSCKSQPETTPHFYQCKCPSRKAWRTSFIKMILDTSETLNLQPTLMMILHDGAVGYLQCRDHLDPLKYPSQYRPLIQQQNTIGWLNFLQGRWSKEWKRL